MDIIIVGQQAWDTEIGSNNKNIALEFSKKHRVLYVNPPLDRATVIREKNDEKVQKRLDIINEKKNSLIEIKDNLWMYYPDKVIESINWIKIGWVYNIINRWNNNSFANAIKKALKELNFKEYILFNDSDMFRSFYLKELLHPNLTIYYSRDYFQANEYYSYHGKRLEPELIHKSDLCVANSPFLVNFCKKYNPNSFYVGQGCDLELFENADINKIPADLQQIHGPVIGYVGALSSARLDVEVLSFVAESRTDWQLVLVGPEDEKFQEGSLHQIPNIHFLGSKDPEELPYYINNFDVCINPQILNDFTRGNYPRKIDEYLAMGKPVVATQTDAMELFDGFTYLAETKNDYVELIEKALKDDSAEKKVSRQAFAYKHSWANSVKAIYQAINKITQKHIEEAKVIEYRTYTL